MSTDPQSHLLSVEESERRFRERIVPRHLAHGVPQEQPVLVIVAGQPGAGKTAVENRVHTDLGGGTVTLDADAFRPTHPDYVPLARDDDRVASQATHADAVRWVEMAKQHCIANRYNVVLSTTMRTPEAAQSNLEEFRKAGYRVEVVAMAVHEATSRLGVLNRYQQGRDDVGFGRYVPDAFQRDAYAGLLSALDHIDNHHLADAVHVYLRDGSRIYSNNLNSDSEWAQPAGARAAVEVGRARPWTAEEVEQFRDQATHLSSRLPDDLRGDLLEVAEAARAHLAETSAPPVAGPDSTGGRAGAAAAAFPQSTRSVMGRSGTQPRTPSQPRAADPGHLAARRRRQPTTDPERENPSR